VTVATDRFFGNQHFLRYARLLRKLHQLIRDGADETDEGEALRNQMDEPAEYLTQDEVDCLNSISADFYTLAGTPAQAQANPPPALRDEMTEMLYARDSGDYIKALELIRKNEAFLDPAVAVYYRGRVWSVAAENTIALDFLQRSKELSPQNEGYVSMWLDSLQFVNSGQALETAERFLQELTDHSPPLILKAAEVVFSSRRQLPETEAVEVAKRLIPVFEDIIVRLEELGETASSLSLLAPAIGFLGICNMDVGNVDTARRWFDKGIHLFPNNLALLITRGIQLYGTDPEQSQQDFNRAIRLEPRVVWPWYFLAHYHLIREQYRECLEMAQTALTLSPLNALRADCLEWIAICQANLGYPPESVRAVFHAAQQLAPDNQRIAVNRQLFEKSVAGTAPSKISWGQPTPGEVRLVGQREFQPVGTSSKTLHTG
jgi:tetratricopeptide (TPR) repeat protein